MRRFVIFQLVVCFFLASCAEVQELEVAQAPTTRDRNDLHGLGPCEDRAVNDLPMCTPNENLDYDTPLGPTIPDDGIPSQTVPYDFSDIVGRDGNPYDIPGEIEALSRGEDPFASTTTTVPTVLFRARNGDVSRGELFARIYVERNVAAGGLSDVDPDGDGWALVGRTNGDGDNGPVARFWVANGVPFVSTRHSQKGCLQLTPQSLAQVKTGQTRLMSEVAQNTALCRTAPPEADVDSNGIADNVQPLYRARNGDPAKGELAARVYVERGLHASEAQIGVSDYDPDGDGWALIGRTNGAGDNGQYVSIAMNGTTPVVKIQHSSKGCIAISPISIELVKRGQTRFVTITSQSPGTCT
jgi:hypothetical protein